MNLTLEPTDAAPTAPASPTPAETPKRSLRSTYVTLGVIAAAVIAVVGVGVAVDRKGDLEGSAALDVAAAVPAEGGASGDAGTGDASVDATIIDAVWVQQKATLCSSLDEVRGTMPTLSDEKIIDMGMSLADMSAITPAQQELLKQHMLNEC